MGAMGCSGRRGWGERGGRSGQACGALYSHLIGSRAMGPRGHRGSRAWGPWDGAGGAGGESGEGGAGGWGPLKSCDRAIGAWGHGAMGRVHGGGCGW